MYLMKIIRNIPEYVDKNMTYTKISLKYNLPHNQKKTLKYYMTLEKLGLQYFFQKKTNFPNKNQI